MSRVFRLVCCLVACGIVATAAARPAFAQASPPSWLFGALVLADTAHTARAMRDPRLYEQNPLLPERPTDAQLAGVAALSLAAYMTAGRLLPDEVAEAVLASAIASEAHSAAQVVNREAARSGPGGYNHQFRLIVGFRF